MGSGHGIVELGSYAQPLAFGLSFHHQYPSFRDALTDDREPVYSQRYIGRFSYRGHLSVRGCALEPAAFIHKRNERERHRVRCVNEGYATLRQHLPRHCDDKTLSKVETLRAAISYIKHLQNLLEVRPPAYHPSTAEQS